MDYSICQAAKYRTGNGPQSLDILLVYDIICQWAKYFRERVQQCDGLDVSAFQKWLVAIGKFHLAVHVKSCFWKYSLNFMQGVGQLDGEIMETCWSPFNPFGTMTRSMGTAQRKEVLNDYMRDANFKKLVGMGMLNEALVGLLTQLHHCSSNAF
jgi:Kyakuja-Dileera-Zisupton transposase